VAMDDKIRSACAVRIAATTGSSMKSRITYVASPVSQAGRSGLWWHRHSCLCWGTFLSR
jgi:hypothetical protein